MQVQAQRSPAQVEVERFPRYFLITPFLSIRPVNCAAVWHYYETGAGARINTESILSHRREGVLELLRSVAISRPSTSEPGSDFPLAGVTNPKGKGNKIRVLLCT